MCFKQHGILGKFDIFCNIWEYFHHFSHIRRYTKATLSSEALQLPMRAEENFKENSWENNIYPLTNSSIYLLLTKKQISRRNGTALHVRFVPRVEIAYCMIVGWCEVKLSSHEYIYQFNGRGFGPSDMEGKNTHTIFQKYH